jgi:hypothetical protein
MVKRKLKYPSSRGTSSREGSHESFVERSCPPFFLPVFQRMLLINWSFLCGHLLSTVTQKKATIDKDFLSKKVVFVA